MEREARHRGGPPPRPVTVEHLRSFVAVAKEGHFGRAAAAVYISPSPFSKRIKELEAAVGARLVERTTRSVHLTAAGQRLLPMAQDLLRRFDGLRWAVRDVPAIGSPEIRVGLPPGGMHPPDRAAVVEAARRALGSCRTSLETMHPGDLEAALRSGARHLAVVNTQGEHVPHDGVVVRVEEYGVALRADHPAASAERVTLSAIAELTYASIFYNPTTPNQRRLIGRVRDAGSRGDPLLVRDVTELVNVLATQPTFTFVPLPLGTAFSRALVEPEIAIRPIDDLGLRRYTLVVWLQERAAADPQLAAIGAELRQAFAAAGNA